MKCFAALLFSFTAAAQPGASELNSRCVDAYAHGDYAVAEALCRESIARWETLGPSREPRLAVARVNLAQALAAEGRRAEARSEAEQAVAVLHASAGPGDPHTLAAMNLLAALDVALGDAASAAPILEEALASERKYDVAGLQLAHTLDVLASVRVRQHRLDEALAAADESLRITIRTAADDSPDVALAYSAAAEVHLAAGRPDRALPLYRRARTIYERRFGPNDLRVVPILTEEALILIGDRKFSLAGDQLRRSLAILDRTCAGCTAERNGAEAALALLRTEVMTATAKSTRR